MIYTCTNPDCSERDVDKEGPTMPAGIDIYCGICGQDITASARQSEPETT